MDRVEIATKKFCAVRDALEPNTPEFRICYSKPLKFYLKHTKEEAIAILRKEVKNYVKS